MAQSSWPFENIDTSETQFSQWARNIGEGVIAGKGLELEAFADSTGMTVKVKSGQALVRGHYYSSSAEETLTVPTADPTNPRIDLIVARLDPAANSIVLALVAGTPAGSPVAPTPTQTEADVYELPIAEVYVGAGVVTISAGNVTDVRTIFTPGAGGVAVIFSDTAPEDTDSIWFNTENGNAYLYYDGFWTSISGISIPAGGTTGQVLAKTSNTDYATQWVSPKGLVHIATQTVSGVTAITFNNCFSASYTSYKIVVSGLMATRGDFLARLRVGGVDASGANYFKAIWYRDSTLFTSGYVTSSTSATLGFFENVSNILTCDVTRPFLSVETIFDANNTGVGSAGTSSWHFGNSHNVIASYDGISFLPTSAFTGSITIYGYGE